MVLANALAQFFRCQIGSDGGGDTGFVKLIDRGLTQRLGDENLVLHEPSPLAKLETLDLSAAPA